MSVDPPVNETHDVSVLCLRNGHCVVGLLESSCQGLRATLDGHGAEEIGGKKITKRGSPFLYVGSRRGCYVTARTRSDLDKWIQ